MILLILSIFPVNDLSLFVYVCTGVFISLVYFPSLDYSPLREFYLIAALSMTSSFETGALAKPDLIMVFSLETDSSANPKLIMTFSLDTGTPTKSYLIMSIFPPVKYFLVFSSEYNVFRYMCLPLQNTLSSKYFYIPIISLITIFFPWE